MARKSTPRRKRTEGSWERIKRIAAPSCFWHALQVGWFCLIALMMMVKPPLRTVVALSAIAVLPVVVLFLMRAIPALLKRLVARR